MYNGIYAALSGSVVQEQRLAILTNNLANIGTAGFKADKPIFQLFPLPVVVGPVPSLQAGGTVSPLPPQPVVTSLDRLLGRDSPQNRLLTVQTDFSQGPIRQTGNPLDLALEGRGFFVVEGPGGGTAYTRQGTFSINSEGFLVTPNGLLVQGERGPIAIRGSQVTIDREGRVLVDQRFVDRLRLVDFPQPYPLVKMGDALFRTRSPLPEEEPTDLVVHQGAIELANSQPIRLMSEVIETVRAYEVYQKVLRAFDETTARAVNDIART
ncbi:MAG: flagellar hook-basal body protein [Nitrospinota bacterium]|nr:MAG: flagellar hook-basal body protein [Nitrospinota bacterium]